MVKNSEVTTEVYKQNLIKEDDYVIDSTHTSYLDLSKQRDFIRLRSGFFHSMVDDQIPFAAIFKRREKDILTQLEVILPFNKGIKPTKVFSTAGQKWNNDYPIITLLKSPNQIGIINMMEKTRREKILNIHPYTAVSLISSKVKCNQSLYGRQYEMESHILLLVHKGNYEFFIMDVRIDPFFSYKKQLQKKSEQPILCLNSHELEWTAADDSEESQAIYSDLSGKKIEAGENGKYYKSKGENTSWKALASEVECKNC